MLVVLHFFLNELDYKIYSYTILGYFEDDVAILFQLRKCKFLDFNNLLRHVDRFESVSFEIYFANTII